MPAEDGCALSEGRWSPDSARSVGFGCPGGPRAAGAARHRVLDELGELLGLEERQNLTLLISELVTNCVRHAGMTQEQDVIAVHAGVAKELMRIEVRDKGPGFTPGAVRLRSVEAGGGGLGLVLLDRLATRWGVARGDDFCVWAEVERAGQAVAV